MILEYTILHYTILYYTLLYYTILYSTILYYTILYSTLLYYTLLYSTLLYYTILLSHQQLCLPRLAEVPDNTTSNNTVTLGIYRGDIGTAENGNYITIGYICWGYMGTMEKEHGNYETI